MGEVYRARDTRLKRTVALKRLAPSLRSDPTYRRRFQQESRRVSSFSDSHIAAVYDVLEDQSEIFLVMEYIEGENLRQRMRQPMTLEQFFEIATQCAEALTSAHESRIVHCDIKPENIMLTAAGQVKILDFGVAKHLPRSDQSSTVDRAGTVGGTPAYMSPEVLLEQIPDGRADIFSLGVVFYEMLSGHHPFLASSFVATTDRIRHETPTPIRIFNPKTPEALEAVVMKMLAKDPAQRYGSATDLLEDLRLVEAGRTPTRLLRVFPLPQPNRMRWWLAAITVVILVAAGYGVYRWLHRPPILSERGWVLITDFESRGDDPLPDAGVREGLTIALQQSQYVNVFPRTRVYEVLQRMRRQDATRIDENLGREICQRENLQVLLTGSIEHVGNIFQITVRGVDPVRGSLLFAERERFSNKAEFFNKEDVLAKRARTDLGESLSRIEATSRPLAKVTTSSIEALTLYSQAKDAMDQENLDQALTPLQGAIELDPDFAMAHLLLGQYYSSIVNKNTRALAELKRAYDLRQSVTDRERLWIEATYLSAVERYEDAEQSLNILAKLYPDDADYHLALAEAYDGTAQPEKTITELRTVLKLRPSFVSAYADLISKLARSNANQEALTVYEQARARQLNSPDLQRSLGLAYFGLGDLPKAQEQFLQLREASQPYQDLSDFYLAKVEIYEGKLAAARAHLQAIIERDIAAGIKGLQPASHTLLSRIYVLVGQYGLARREADQIMHAPAADLQVFDMLSAGIIYARVRSLAPARLVLQRLESAVQDSPTAWNKRCSLTLEAEIAIADASPKAAEQVFLEADKLYPQASTDIGLAAAYEEQQAWQQAAGQWQKVLDSRGEILQEEFPADLVLANLHLARISTHLGDTVAARRGYEEFLRIWHEADDIPERRQAARELQKLTSAVSNTQ